MVQLVFDYSPGAVNTFVQSDSVLWRCFWLSSCARVQIGGLSLGVEMSVQSIAMRWMQDTRSFFSMEWWKRFVFFSWRRLVVVWKQPYFLLTVAWLQIMCLWGGVAPWQIGCFCFDPSMVWGYRIALFLLQLWYFYLVGMFVRVSLYPHTAAFFRRIEQERGHGWALQLLLPAAIWSLLLDIPAIWPFGMFWFLIAADGRLVGLRFVWRLLLCTVYSVIMNAPIVVIVTLVVYWLAYWMGSALVLYFVLVPFMFAATSVVYTQNLARN